MSEKEELSNQEKIVKDYLEQQIKKDSVLKSLYVPAKIKDCFQYITNLAREKAVNGCAMIEDVQVFKWARDYYLDELPKHADKKTVEIVQNKNEKTVSDDIVKNKTVSIKKDSDDNLLFEF